MSPESFIVVACLVAAPVGLGWEEILRRQEGVMARRRMCDHEPGSPFVVKNSRPPHYKQYCSRGCGAQRHCEPDGKPYLKNADWH